MHRARRHLTPAVGAAAFLLVAAGPALASQSQTPVCDFGQRGHTYWRLAEAVDQIVSYHGIWRHRNGGSLVHSETQYARISGPTNIEIWGQGDSQWAVWGVVVGDDDWRQRGSRCTGDPTVADTVDRATPDAMTGRLTPPPVAVAHPELVSVTGPLLDPA